MQQWEYFVAPLLPHNPGDILNTFGDEGWELVSVVPRGAGAGADALFKRPVPSDGEVAGGDGVAAGLQAHLRRCDAARLARRAEDELAQSQEAEWVRAAEERFSRLPADEQSRILAAAEAALPAACRRPLIVRAELHRLVLNT